MDRRAALVRLAAGGTVAAVASIRSTPAFAYSAPQRATEATITAVEDNARRVTVTVTSVGTASCPASATAAPTSVYVRSDLTTVSISSGAILQRQPFSTNPLPSSVTTLSFAVRRLDPDGPNRFMAGDAFSVEVIADFTCTYAGDATTARLSSTRLVTFDGANFVVT
jgi:hypothetical protein